MLNKIFRLNKDTDVYPVHYGPRLGKLIAVTQEDKIFEQPNGLYCIEIKETGTFVYGVKIPRTDLDKIT